MQVAEESNTDCARGIQLPVTSVAMDTFAKRLRSRLDAAGKTAQWLADQSGVSRQAVTQWLDGKTESARGDAILKAARALHCDPYWLLLGEEPDSPRVMFSRSGKRESVSGADDPLADYTLVPRLSVRAGMGPGQELHSEQITDALAFRTSYLDVMGVRPSQALCMRCIGDSMAPRLSLSQPDSSSPRRYH